MSTPIQLRNYQLQLISDVERVLSAGARNVIAALSTGGGKTACAAELSRRISAAGQTCVVIAHRRELVGQLAEAHARAGVPHKILAPDTTIARCIQRQINNLGSHWVHRDAAVTIAGVDTLLRRECTQLQYTDYWQTDECHHLLPTNKWGRAAAMMPSARGVGWTATPIRADGRPLARPAGGAFDAMVQGPSTAWLTVHGYLVPLQIYSLPPAVDRGALPLSQATGDFSAPALRAATTGSTIVGDVVQHYLRIAPGLQGATFCVDVEAAEQTAAAYRAAGVSAECLSDRTPDRERDAMLTAYARGDLLQLTCVDILGEGFDAPDMRVVSLARATASLPLCWQQIGRVRRPAHGKSHGIIIDHVGNVLEHGLPDGVELWQLDEQPRRALSPGGRTLPVRRCTADDCWATFEGWSTRCPYCGHMPKPAPARRPEQVEGDLTAYGPELIEELRKRAGAAVLPPPPRNGGARTARDVVIDRHMAARAEAQEQLREAMAWWAGIRMHLGSDEPSAYREFWRTFGIDAASAWGLPGPEAIKLTERVRRDSLLQ